MYSKPKRIFFILATIVVMTIIGTFPMFFFKLSAQQTDSRPEKRMGMKPIPLAPEEENSQKRLKRESKNRQYDKRQGENLEEQGEGEIFGRVTETPPTVPIPVTISDLIVIGKVTKAQPYLSESKTAIYSEFTISIEEVLKNHTDNSMSVGSSVIADREGGAIIKPNGKVMQYLVGGLGALPEQNLRYLFFLKANKNLGDYTILTGYELNTNGISPLENYQDRDVYRGKSESEFISEVKRKLSTD